MQSGLNSEVFDKFARIAGAINNSEVENWKKQGGKVMGYFCSFIPEEIFIAAGLLPFRMRATGSCGTDQADVYFSSNNCSFPRHCFNQALVGKYDFLDGLVVGTSCDNLRRIYDNWKISSVKTSFLYMMDRARTSGEPMVEYTLSELRKLKAGMEAHFKVTITDEGLWQAIRLTNATRRLQQQLYELRKADSPPITGAETVPIMVSSFSMPKEKYNAGLTTLLGELRGVAGSKAYRARIMIVGTGQDDTFLCDLVENQGGLVVMDQACWGARTMCRTIAETGADPLQAIARHHTLDVPFCAKMNAAFQKRAQFVLDMIKAYRVSGVIIEHFVSCEPWGVDSVMLKQRLDEAKVPYLQLVRDYIPSQIGQMTTRVGAFLEMIGGVL